MLWNWVDWLIRYLFYTVNVSDVNVVVVGAGISGLSAASQLIKQGFRNVIILEAHDRIGGRIKTEKFGDSQIEIGAQWIHGVVGNPIFEIAEKNNLVGETVNEKIGLYDSEFRTQHGELTSSQMANDFGELINSIAEECKEIAMSLKDNSDADVAAENRNTSILDFLQRKYSEHIKSENQKPKVTSIKRAFFNWYLRLRNTLESCDSLAQMSIKSASDYKTFDGNPNVNLKHGYLSILSIVRANVPDSIIHLNTPVQSIYIAEPVDGTTPVTVTCENGEVIHAHHVISTVSLGYLKQNMNSYFKPNLPENKKEAIQALGFGTFNKIFLKFEKPFWTKETLGYSFLWVDDSNHDGNKNPDKVTMADTWYKAIVGFYATTFEPDVLSGWVAGEEARYMESLTDSEVLNTSIRLLKQFTGIADLPKVTKIVRSSWSSDKFTLGSYSYKKKECDHIKDVTGDLNAPLLITLDNKDGDGKHEHPAVLFGGEATHPDYYSTVHGAYMTGIREADRLVEYYK